MVVENLVHKSLIICSCVLETKRHKFVAIVSTFGDGSGFFFIRIVYGYLIVLRQDCLENRPCNISNFEV